MDREFYNETYEQIITLSEIQQEPEGFYPLVDNEQESEVEISGDTFYEMWKDIAFNAEKKVYEWVCHTAFCGDKAQEKISELKSMLESSDYKVIKCMEAQLTSAEMPYDISKLSQERQIIRDRINELEQLIEQASSINSNNNSQQDGKSI